MMAPKGAEIYVAIFIFIILTDFVTFDKFCALNEKPARNRRIPYSLTTVQGFFNYKTLCMIVTKYSKWNSLWI